MVEEKPIDFTTLLQMTTETIALVSKGGRKHIRR